MDANTTAAGSLWSFGLGLETFPKEYAQTTKKGGMRKKTFTNPDDLAVFEAELLKRFMKLHPTAAKPPKHPDYPAYYIGNARAFGMERQFTSAFAMVLKKLKSDVASIVFSKKPKAQALFLDTEGGGPGVIAIDSSANAFVVAKISAAEGDDTKELLPELERTQLSKLKPQGQVKLSDTVVIFDSSRTSSEVAQHNWSTPNLKEGLGRTAQANSCGPIKAPIGTRWRSLLTHSPRFIQLRTGPRQASGKRHLQCPLALARLVGIATRSPEGVVPKRLSFPAMAR